MAREAGAEDGRARALRAVSRRIRECAVAPAAANRTRSSKPASPPPPPEFRPNTIAGLAVASRAVATRFVSTAPGRIGVSRSFRGIGSLRNKSAESCTAPRAAGREVSGRPVALAAPTTLRTLVGDGVNAAAEAGRLAARAAARRLSSMLVSAGFGFAFAFAFGSRVSRVGDFDDAPDVCPRSPSPFPDAGDSTGRTVKSTSTTTPSLFGGRPLGWSLRCRVR